MHGEYKTCLRYKKTRAGRRCAKYGPGTGRRGLGGRYRHCVRYKMTRAGERCAKFRPGP